MNSFLRPNAVTAEKIILCSFFCIIHVERFRNLVIYSKRILTLVFYVYWKLFLFRRGTFLGCVPLTWWKPNFLVLSTWTPYRSFYTCFSEVFRITDTSLEPFPSTPVHEKKFATAEYNASDHGKSKKRLRKREGLRDSGGLLFSVQLCAHRSAIFFLGKSKNAEETANSFFCSKAWPRNPLQPS